MKILDDKILQNGDIILTMNDGIGSGAIRKATKGDVSHALIYVGQCSAIDAMPEGVHARNTQRLLFPDDAPIRVMRLKDPLTDAEMGKVCDFARSLVGTPYSKSEAFKVVMGSRKQPSRKQFCSRLVAQVYFQAGRRLVKDPNYCSPADIAASSELSVVEDALRKATEQEKNWNSNSQDATQAMREATNALLDEIRKRKRDILEINQVHEHLIIHREDDDFFYAALVKSGYLDVWQLSYEPYPWRYHIPLMDTMDSSNPEVSEYCRDTISNGASEYRFAVNRSAFQELSGQYKLKTFAAFLGLYDHLYDLNRRRQVVARHWLTRHDRSWLTAWDFEHQLEPHSVEWFKVMDVVAAPVAQGARQRIAEAGSHEACSSCGGLPTVAVTLPGNFVAPGLEGTLRLCDECRSASSALKAD